MKRIAEIIIKAQKPALCVKATSCTKRAYYKWVHLEARGITSQKSLTKLLEEVQCRLRISIFWNI